MSVMSQGPEKVSIHDIFGSELPQASRDEREPDGDSGGEGRDAWLRDNVPPHHI